MTVLPGCLACPGMPPWSRPAGGRRLPAAQAGPVAPAGRVRRARRRSARRRSTSRGHRPAGSSAARPPRRAFRRAAPRRPNGQVPPRRSCPARHIHRPSHLLEALAVKVGELLRAARQRGGAVPSPPGAHDAGAGLPGQLGRQVANCSLAPCTSTVCPGRRPAWSNSACQAVSPASDSAAALT